ncbi:MAG: hypothetical protein ABIV39_18210 [Verrucomicrobiota bacterium]
MSSNQLPPSTETNRKSQGIPMGVALAFLLVLMVVIAGAIGGVWYYIHNDKLKLERELAQAQTDTLRAEIAAKTAAQNSGLALAKTRQEELLGVARAATNTLTRLMVESAQLKKDAETLKNNEAGKKVALFPELVVQARRFYEIDLKEIAPRESIVAKLEGARRIELQLLETTGTSYEPAPEIQSTIQSFKTSGEEALQNVTRARQIFSTLISESKIKVTDTVVTDASLTLEQAMEKSALAETKAVQRVLIENSTGAKQEAAKIAAEAETKGLVSKAERLRNEALAKAREETDEQARELALREAEGKIKDTETKVAVQSAEEQKQNLLFRKKASDPKIKVKLAPFITPGYAQIYHDTLDKKPISYKELQAFGALNPDFGGVDKLITVATAPLDKVRPRWKFNRNFYRSKPEVLEMVKETQGLLIELGPVLVEMGLLQP